MLLSGAAASAAPWGGQGSQDWAYRGDKTFGYLLLRSNLNYKIFLLLFFSLGRTRLGRVLLRAGYIQLPQEALGLCRRWGPGARALDA